MKKFKLGLLAALVSISTLSFAEDAKVDTSKPTPEQTDQLAVQQAIKTKIGGFFGVPDAASFIAETPIPNAYLVSLSDGSSLVYFKDSHYAVSGDMYDLESRKNISSVLKSGYNKTILEKIKPEDTIVYASTDSTKEAKKVFVFTDPTCGYCRKLHNELASYESQGLDITYVPFPRGGKGTFGYNELIDVWCSKDRKGAMDLAKSDQGAVIKTLPDYKIDESCRASVDKGVELGAKLGINGTPALFTANGQAFPGYIEATQLRQMVDDFSKK